MPGHRQFYGGRERLPPRNTHFPAYNTGFLLYNTCLSYQALGNNHARTRFDGSAIRQLGRSFLGEIFRERFSGRGWQRAGRPARKGSQKRQNAIRVLPLYFYSMIVMAQHGAGKEGSRDLPHILSACAAQVSPEQKAYSLTSATAAVSPFFFISRWATKIAAANTTAVTRNVMKTFWVKPATRKPIKQQPATNSA